jgi:hypothetical protein
VVEEAVKLTEQLPELLLPVIVQLLAESETLVPVTAKVTGSRLKLAGAPMPPVSVTVAVQVPVPENATSVGLQMIEVLVVCTAAVWYGPTMGPPPPGAPTGTTASEELSAIARARFSRPFPV